MAQNHIAINQGVGVFAAGLAQLARYAAGLGQLADFHKKKMDQMINASDYTMVEAQYGLAAGKGILTYNLLSGTLTHVAGTSTLNEVSLRDFISWLGIPP